MVKTKMIYNTRDSSDETRGNWYLDSGCSNHMAKDRSMFKDIDDSIKGKVRLGNDTWCSQKEKAPKSLICTIYDNYNKRHDTTNIAMKVEADDSWLWHQKFGHFNSQALKLLYQKNMMRDMSYLKERSLIEKQHKLLFSTNKVQRAKDLLELIRTNIYGPMMTLSLKNIMYFILFIDDFSRMT
ncbi:hypothetical protein CR513_07479, partial [Mucuna pruriens]